MLNKGGDPEINYIKRFQNDKALEISVGYSYSEYQLMHTFLYNLHQGGIYQTELRIKWFFYIKNSYIYLPYKLITWIWIVQYKIHKEKTFTTQGTEIVEDHTKPIFFKKQKEGKGNTCPINFSHFYINEFKPYLPFSQRVMYGFLYW